MREGPLSIMLYDIKYEDLDGLIEELRNIGIDIEFNVYSNNDNYYLYLNGRNYLFDNLNYCGMFILGYLDGLKNKEKGVKVNEDEAEAIGD